MSRQPDDYNSNVVNTEFMSSKDLINDLLFSDYTSISSVASTEFESILSSPCTISDSTPSSPRAVATSLVSLSPPQAAKENISKHAQRLAKNRDRMRRRRTIERAERSLLQAHVKSLTEQLHQLLKIRGNYTNNTFNPQETLKNCLTSPQDVRRQHLIQSYMQLIALSEQLRKEYEQNEHILHTKWDKYAKFVHYQMQQYYDMTTLPKDPAPMNSNKKNALSKRVIHPDLIKSKIYNINDDGKWVSFVLNSPLHKAKNDNRILLFREGTDDIYFRCISDSDCTKILADVYEEGIMFTSVIHEEVQNSSRTRKKEIEYFGWKLIYYPISTEEAYPNLTLVTQVDTPDSKDLAEEMIRIEYVKRYKLESGQNFESMFSQIRERCWKVMMAPIQVTGLHASQKSMVGCVLQQINEQSCIIIRSFTPKSSQTIHRFVSMTYQTECEYIVSILNPLHCIQRVKGQDEIKLEDGNSSKYTVENSNIFWETHGHFRFCWNRVGNRDFEIRYGGTLLLGNYSVNVKIGQLGEMLVGWEQIIFQKPPS